MKQAVEHGAYTGLQRRAVCPSHRRGGFGIEITPALRIDKSCIEQRAKTGLTNPPRKGMPCTFSDYALNRVVLQKLSGRLIGLQYIP